MKKPGKVMAAVISAAFFLQICSSPVWAASINMNSNSSTSPSSSTAGAPLKTADPVPSAPSGSVDSPDVLPGVSLETAIQTVKQNFSIPDSLTNFTSNYSTNGDQHSWALQWNTPRDSGKYGNFSATVDAVNGDILSIYSYSDDSKLKDSQLSKISKADAQKNSDDLIARLLGERTADLKLMPADDEIVPVNYNMPASYSFRYQRFINGIPLMGDGVNIAVSGEDGHIVSYNLNWNDVKAPPADGAISAEQAGQGFASAPFFKLQYWLPTSIVFLKAGEKQDVKLVYQLQSSTGGAIDALTGKPLTLKPGEMINVFSGYGMGDAKGAMGQAATSSVPAPLTPQEQQEVDLTSKLLKQDEALAVVKQWLDIPDNLTLRNANLSSDWRSADNRIWNFNWADSSPNPNPGSSAKPQYLNARVNAVNGELVGFNRGYQSNPGEVKFDRAAMQKIAEDFLKKVQPQRFQQAILDSADSLGLYPGAIPDSSGNFQYHRIVNGIDFPNNSLTVSVDPADGTITNYDLNWQDYNFPATDGILSRDQAVQAFLSQGPLTLAYVRIYTDGLPGDVRLVYLPVSQEQSAQTSNILDAFSGKLLNYQGKPLDEGPKPYIFTDLNGVDGAQEIAALGEAGLFGDYGNQFNPQETMTAASLLRAMYYNQFGQNDSTMSLSDADILTKAKEQGWLKEDLQPGDTVSRELLCKILLRYAQLSKVAELEDIYQLKFQDADQISPDALGYVALATGSGILKVQGDTLAPQAAVSRAEAAAALYRAITWQNQ